MKPLVEWSDELSVGIEEIDEQHKVLVGLVNNMHAAIVEHKGSDATKVILRQLIQYTVIHFAVEESLMRIFDYDDYETHKLHHRELTKQVLDLKRKVDRGHTTISFELMHFLKQWLTNHITKEDMLYSPCFISGGVRSAWSKRSWLGKIWDTVHH